MTDVQSWQPSKLGEEVYIRRAEGHELPAMLEGLEESGKGRVVKGRIIERVNGPIEGLWLVQLSPPLTEKVQVHRDQLEPVNCPECGSQPGTHNIACKLAKRDREAASGKKARADVIKQIRDLAPHEVKCTCSYGGDFDMSAHSEFCARKQLAHVLSTVEARI